MASTIADTYIYRRHINIKRDILFNLSPITSVGHRIKHITIVALPHTSNVFTNRCLTHIITFKGSPPPPTVAVAVAAVAVAVAVGAAVAVAVVVENSDRSE